MKRLQSRWWRVSQRRGSTFYLRARWSSTIPHYSSIERPHKEPVAQESALSRRVSSALKFNQWLTAAELCLEDVNLALPQKLRVRVAEACRAERRHRLAVEVLRPLLENSLRPNATAEEKPTQSAMTHFFEAVGNLRDAPAAMMAIRVLFPGGIASSNEVLPPWSACESEMDDETTFDAGLGHAAAFALFECDMLYHVVDIARHSCLSERAELLRWAADRFDARMDYEAAKALLLEAMRQNYRYSQKLDKAIRESRFAKELKQVKFKMDSNWNSSAEMDSDPLTTSMEAGLNYHPSNMRDRLLLKAEMHLVQERRACERREFSCAARLGDIAGQLGDISLLREILSGNSQERDRARQVHGDLGALHSDADTAHSMIGTQYVVRGSLSRVSTGFEASLPKGDSLFVTSEESVRCALLRGVAKARSRFGSLEEIKRLVSAVHIRRGPKQARSTYHSMLKGSATNTRISEILEMMVRHGYGNDDEMFEHAIRAHVKENDMQAAARIFDMMEHRSHRPYVSSTAHVLMLFVAGASQEEEVATALITHLLETDKLTPGALRAAVYAAGRLKNTQLLLGLLRKGKLLPWFEGEEEFLRESLVREHTGKREQSSENKIARLRDSVDKKPNRRRRRHGKPPVWEDATVVLNLPQREGSSAWCTALARTAIISLAECGRKNEVQQLLQQIQEEHGGLIPDGTLRAAFSAFGKLGDEKGLMVLLKEVGDPHTGYMTAREWDTLFGIICKLRGPREALQYVREIHEQGGPTAAVATFATILASANAEELDDPDLLVDFFEAIDQVDSSAHPYLMNVVVNVFVKNAGHRAIEAALEKVAVEKWPLLMPSLRSKLEERGVLESTLPLIERIQQESPSIYTETFEVDNAMELLVPRGLQGSRGAVQNRLGLRNVRREVEMSNRRLEIRQAAEQLGLDESLNTLIGAATPEELSSDDNARQDGAMSGYQQHPPSSRS